MYCYLEFKLRYLKNLKLFSIRVKELFELIVLRRVFALFKSIFLRNRSLSNARWFWCKKCKIGKGNLFLTENRLSRNEMWCESDNHNNMSHIYAKELLDSNFIKQLFTKYKFLIKLPQISHIDKNHNFFKYNWKFWDQLLLPYIFHGSDIWGMYFFIFASCEPLKMRQVEVIFSR